MRAGFERLYQTLVGPPRLEDDPVYQRMRAHIERLRAAHMPTRGATEALTQYVHALLRSGK